MTSRKKRAADSDGKGRPRTSSPPQTPTPPPAPPSTRLIVALSILLALATLAVYAQTATHGFIAYDDDQYVYDNAMVKEGLTVSGVHWAFTTFHAANWHPVTWLSHMLDCQFFGGEPGPAHMMNTALHAANVILLFLALVWMTKRPWESVIVAAIFALHPLHVESVAWVSERKDVLSTFFGLWTILFYISYAKAPGLLTFVPVMLSFALALMSKPMLVTLPFVLLLLDVWPLGRLPLPPAWRRLGRLLLEKAPLLAMVAVAGALTFVAQQRFGAVASLSRMDFSARLANASIGYVRYIGNAFLPVRLAVLYPITPPVAKDAVAACFILTAVTIAAFAFAKKRPYILVGWLWFIGMLVPVIGIVQVGSQSMADRYMYLPLVGLSLAVVWLAADLVRNRPPFRRAAGVVAVLALFFLGMQAYSQAALWKSSRSLFEHTIDVTDKNYIVHNNLGVALAADKDFANSVAHYEKALAIRPDYAEAHANLGHELLALGRFDDAYTHLTAAEKTLPGNATVQADLGTLLAAQGKFDESLVHFEESLRIDAAQANVHSNLGFVLLRLGRIDESIAQCGEALRLDPGLADAHYNMGMALAAQGRLAEASAEFSRTLALKPDHAGARTALARLNSSPPQHLN